MTNSSPAMTDLRKFMFRILNPDLISGSPPTFVGMVLGWRATFPYNYPQNICLKCEIMSVSVIMHGGHFGFMQIKQSSIPSIKLLICYLNVISETCGGGINYVAICGGSLCIFTGL